MDVYRRSPQYEHIPSAIGLGRVAVGPRRRPCPLQLAGDNTRDFAGRSAGREGWRRSMTVSETRRGAM